MAKPFKQNPGRRFSTPAPPVALSPVHPVLRAVVSTVVPEASALGEKGWTELKGLIEIALRDRPPALKHRLRHFLRLVQWLPVARYGRPFTSLNAAQRTRFLSYLEDHPIQLIRVGFWGVRTLALLGYYGRPEVADDIGYAGDPRGWEALG